MRAISGVIGAPPLRTAAMAWMISSGRKRLRMYPQAPAFSAWLALKIDSEINTQWAIVIAGPVEARNGPGFENTVGFTLPEGKKVTVLGVKDDWAAVGLRSEGLKGWVERKYIEQI